jgi:transcriptional regulator with XRE-family HTH domain
MTGEELKAWRRRHQYTQSALGDKLGVSQKAVSVWEKNIHGTLPVWVESRLQNGQRESGEISDTHSWPVSIFEALQKHALKTAKEVGVSAIISPSEKDPERFADFAAEIRFSELRIPDGLGLYLDHIRDAGDDRSAGMDQSLPLTLVLGGSKLIGNSTVTTEEGLKEVAIRQGDSSLLVGGRTTDSSQHITKLINHGPTARARLIENDILRAPNCVAYEIRDADDRDPVSVFIRSDCGYNLSKTDAVGFTYYTEADFLIERIKLQVEFKNGLVPEPDPPQARAQLIRRTSVRPNNLSSGFPLPKKETLQEGTTRYTFGPLLRPKGGYLYSLVWLCLSRHGQREPR